MAAIGLRVPAVPPAATTMAAVLAAFGSALLLERLAHLGVDIGIQAVVLSITLARTQRDATPTDQIIGFAVFPAVAFAAIGLGTLMSGRPIEGDAAFVLLVTAAIWIRRFGPRFARAGTLAMLPPIALLVTPHTPTSGNVLWAPVVALIAWFWVTAFQLLVDVPASASAGRSRASNRMAAQMAVALAGAFAAGHLLFPDHWSWVVLTAFIVCNGARGQGDALHKSVLRALGATGGTLLATLAAGTFAPGNRGSIALIFAVLGVAVWLRPRNYAYWAGGVTAALSLLYGYFGQAAMPLLWTRMEAILAGAVIGVASAWFVLPFRTGDVQRRRTVEVLANLTDVLKGAPDALTRFELSVAELDKLYPPLKMHRTLTRQNRHPADVIDLLRGIAIHVHALGPDTGALRVNVAAARRAIARRTDGAPYRSLDCEDVPTRAVDEALAAIHDIYAPPTRAQESPDSTPPHA
ncbi:FUSC family protein [Actinomadura darangshiensis]|uniref:FUSC family protein n=1 Tax=Actinomadura darangshiensis TaxID=705336 RepID=A0A4R5A4Q7_9ACTN|nr:FUSC family protein [Actinomadura darangshiensis]TDD65906.1 FUSC family protein [Actinomadura darangshiensis]